MGLRHRPNTESPPPPISDNDVISGLKLIFSFFHYSVYLEYKTKPPASFVRAVGQDLFIPCEFLYADTEVQWTFKNKLGELKVIREGVVATGLNVTGVTMDSEGLYTCSASNQYGNLSANSTLKQVHASFNTWKLSSFLPNHKYDYGETRNQNSLKSLFFDERCTLRRFFTVVYGAREWIDFLGMDIILHYLLIFQIFQSFCQQW